MILNARCYICNSVSAEEIQTELGSFSKQNFFQDPSDRNRYICEGCMGVHQELMHVYECKDQPWKAKFSHNQNDPDDLVLPLDEVMLELDFDELPPHLSDEANGEHDVQDTPF